MSQLELRGIRKTYPGIAEETLKGIDIDIASPVHYAVLACDHAGLQLNLQLRSWLQSCGIAPTCSCIPYSMLLSRLVWVHVVLCIIHTRLAAMYAVQL